MVIPGNAGAPIRRIHWVEVDEPTSNNTGDQSNLLYTEAGQPRRLITVGVNGYVIEWDLCDCAIKAKLNVDTAIWDSRLIGKHLYLAQESGRILLVKVKKDSFVVLKTFQKAQARCLSIEVSPDETFAFAGYSDGSIMKWDLKENSCSLNMQNKTAGADAPLIWCLDTVDRYLFSGDSHGCLKVWDTEHGTLLTTFKQLQADIQAIAVNPKFGIVYATGVDSRILSVQYNTVTEKWVQLGLFRGQSHDIKSLVLTSANELLSGGDTTDICVYKMDRGTLAEQFGKNSAQQQKQTKLRHVPPFPFRSPVRMSGDLLVVLSGCGTTLELWSIKSQQCILKIVKKGDYKIRDFDCSDGLIAYSDAVDTQVFKFDTESLLLKKVST